MEVVPGLVEVGLIVPIESFLLEEGEVLFLAL